MTCINNNLLTKNVLELNHNKINFPNLNIKQTNNLTKPQIILEDIYFLISKYKNQIETIKNQKIWDFCKKLTNDFEMIHLYNKNSYSITYGVANYEPISRSYFKMWEMIKDFDLINIDDEKMNIFCFAEGPGGFVEAICNYRKIYSNTVNDNITCMTLKSYKSDIPGWKKSSKLFKENQNIEIYYGIDNTGDLYNFHNLIGLENKSKDKKCKLVTADGGFDFSIDYNKQEELSYRLIICEIVAAITVLKIDGHFVIKIFDNITNFTLKIIYFLTSLFLKINIVKPFTSRPANSEKYIICKNFIGINQSDLNNLYQIINDWEILVKENKKVIDIFDIELPYNFIKIIKEYNLYILHKQINNILKTLTYSKINLCNSDINFIKQNQAILSSLWCLKYDIPINYRCKFLNNDTEHYNYIPNF